MGEDVHQRYGFDRIINASGTMTALGAARIRPEAMAAAAEISGHFVDMNQLQAHASGVIAMATGGAGGFITSCTAIEQSVRVAGARVMEIGRATEVNAYHLRGALRDSDDIVAALYVQSHHCVMEGMLSLAEFTAICHEFDVPVIADMASEFALGIIKDPGVDIAVYSVHKYIGGTTGGIYAARTERHVRDGYLQNRGIGRLMKIGKEGVAGAIAAIESWVERDHEADRRLQGEILEHWREKLSRLPGVTLDDLPDWTGNPIDRIRMRIDPAEAGLHAWELQARLAAGSPRIHMREQFLEQQILVLDPCNLTLDEAKEVTAAVVKVVNEALSEGNGRSMSWDEYKLRASQGILSWPGR